MENQSRYIINSIERLEAAKKELEEAFYNHKYITMSWNSKKRRTLPQNSSLHLFFRMLAAKFNDAGLDQRKVLKQSVEIPWSEHSIKEHIWRPIQLAATQKESSATLTTQEIQYVYEILNSHLANRFGFTIEWPEAQQDG